MNKTLIFLFFITSIGSVKAADPVMQTLTGGTTFTCPQDNTLTLQGSEVGFDYYLRNEADNSIVDGPVAGTGNALDFQTGVVSETSSYLAFAANPSYSLDFDGVDDTVNIPHDNSLNFSTGLTIEAWVYPTNITNGNQEIYRKEGTDAVGRVLFSFQNNGTILSFGTHTTTNAYTELDVTINPADYNNQWVHVLAFFDDATNAMRIYRNGVEVGSKTSNGTLVNSANPQSGYIGSWNGTSEFFQGKIAALRLWNTAPSSAQEVADLLTQGQQNLFVGDETGLAAYYAFSENTGTQLIDNSVNTNNGTINGANWTTGTNGGVGQIASNIHTLSPAMNNVYVDQNASGTKNGTSWADAYTTVTHATDFINNKCLPNSNDVIHIAQGNYKEGAEIVINHPITIKGGYPTGGGVQDIDNNPTMIDGNHSHRVLKANHTTGTLFIDGLSIQNGRLSGNNNAEGAGINTTGNLTLNSVTVSNNTASSSSNSNSSGGGIYTNSGNITLTNSLVSNNTASSFSASSFSFSDGGGIYTSSGNITLTNSLVSNNTASSFSSSDGGGIYTNIGNIALINSLVINNTASSTSFSPFGGGIFTGNGINNQNLILFQNSIMWGNTKSTDDGSTFSASEYHFLNPVNLTINHSLIKSQNPTGTANIDATIIGFDPLFIDEANGNFGLQKNSVLVNTGDDMVNTSTLDLLGNSRKNGDIDIGPYEAPDFSQNNYNTAANAYYFNPNSTANGQDGLSWTTAFKSLNDYFYIQDKSNINHIYLAKGAYKTSGTLEFTTALIVDGGYDTKSNTQTTELSVIDVQKNGRVISTTQDISFTSCLIINGFMRSDSNSSGGGIYTNSGNITLTNSLVSNNTASSFSASSFSASSFSDGGGIYTNSGNVTLTNSLVSNNTAASSSFDSNSSSDGGGIYTNNGSIILTNSLVINNTASSSSSFDSNSSSDGGGIYTGSGKIALINSLVSNNTASSFSSSDGGGISTGNGINNQVEILFQNSILWGNKISTNGGTTFSENEYHFTNPVNSLTINHSLVKNQNLTGTSNIDATAGGFNPLFVDEANGNFRLQAGSSLIDAGDDLSLPFDNFDIDNDGDFNEIIPYDLDKKERLVKLLDNLNSVDIGPYELQELEGLIFLDGFE
jgi:hypothetical protein